MSLPTTLRNISASQLYPDAIRLTFQFRPENQNPDETQSRNQSGNLEFLNRFFNAARNAHGPRNSSSRVQFRLSVAELSGDCFVTLSRPPGSALISVSVSVNPLRVMHGRVGGETAHDASDNWLGPSQVRRDNRRVWRRTDRIVAAVSNSLEERLNAFPVCAAQGFRLRKTGIFVFSVEVVVDVSSANPHQSVQRYLRAISEICSDDTLRSYPVSERYAKNSYQLDGWVRSGLRVKVYSKTTSRVRIELQYNKKALQKLRSTREINTTDQPFSAYFEMVANDATSVFRQLYAVRRRNSVPPPTSAPATELIERVYSATRDKQLATNVLSTLCANRRLHSSIDRQLVYRLRQSKVLRKTEQRGRYVVTARYRRAVRAIRKARNFSRRGTK